MICTSFSHISIHNVMFRLYVITDNLSFLTCIHFVNTGLFLFLNSHFFEFHATQYFTTRYFFHFSDHKQSFLFVLYALLILEVCTTVYFTRYTLYYVLEGGGFRGKQGRARCTRTVALGILHCEHHTRSFAGMSSAVRVYKRV